MSVKEELGDVKFPVSLPWDSDAKTLPQAATASSGEVQEPVTFYTCGACTRTVALTPTSQMMCTHCVHFTGSSTVFYKTRTEATTDARAQPMSAAVTTSGGSGGGARAGMPGGGPRAGPSAPVPQCYCAACHTPQHLPRPSPTGILFQCSHCRMVSGGDTKVLYVKRCYPTEHATR